MSNIFNMRCPACSRDDRIDIAATLWVRVCEDGTDADESHDGDHEFSPDSPACCEGCGFRGEVASFDLIETGVQP